MSTGGHAGSPAPYGRRAVIVTASALGLILSVAAGTLAALAPEPQFVAVTVIAL